MSAFQSIEQGLTEALALDAFFVFRLHGWPIGAPLLAAEHP